MTTIGIILGSTRPGRNGEAVAKWVYDIASSRTDAAYELVDLRDHPLPHLDEGHAAFCGSVPVGAHPQMGRQDRVVRRLRHGHTGVQPFDLWRVEERNRLPVRRMAQQGSRIRQLWSVGGARATEHLRLIAGELKMADSRTSASSGPATMPLHHWAFCSTKWSHGRTPSRHCVTDQRCQGPVRRARWARRTDRQTTPRIGPGEHHVTVGTGAAHSR
jgi:hypothetical protein